ncbi:MAG TPA: oligosaccharide flippase family protein [Candidatus Nanoarchaeia archaeon]
MNTPFKLAYNTAVQLIGKAITTLSTAIIIYLLVIPKFSVGEFGIFNTILSYTALFYVFTDFGLNAIFVREIGADPEKQKEYFKKLFGLRLIVSILVAFIATAVLAFTDYPVVAKLGIIIGLGLIFAQTLAATSLALFQARIRYDQAVIADTIGAVANLILVFLAVRGFDSILFVIAALVAGGVIRVLVAFYLVRFQLGEISPVFDLNFARKIAFAAFPIGLVLIFSQFNAQIDKQIVLLADYKSSLNLTGVTAAGFYGFAYKIFELAIYLPAFVMNVGYPIMVQKKEAGIGSLISFTKKLAIALVFLGVFGLILGWVAAPFIFGILIFQKFSPALLATRILFLGFPLFFITPLTLWLAITLGKTKEMLFIYGFAAAVNLVANLVLVPRFGYNAAAIVTIASELLILGLSIGVLFIAFRTEKR